MRAIQVRKFGGPEVLELHDVPDPVSTGGLIAVDVSTVGINYADTHQTENSYHQPAQLPLIPGAEVVGTTADGERIVALLPSGGGYAERAVVSAALALALPDGVQDDQALALPPLAPSRLSSRRDGSRDRGRPLDHRARQPVLNYKEHG